MTGAEPTRVEQARVGLCATCAHAHVIENRRGSRFYRCRRSDDDPAFPKYPRLPVVACVGYEAHDEHGGAGGTSTPTHP